MVTPYQKEALRYVALLAEGVDRNHQKLAPFVPAEVALLAEGVDRNILTLRKRTQPLIVALLAEGVDRNLMR